MGSRWVRTLASRLCEIGNLSRYARTHKVRQVQTPTPPLLFLSDRALWDSWSINKISVYTNKRGTPVANLPHKSRRRLAALAYRATLCQNSNSVPLLFDYFGICLYFTSLGTKPWQPVDFWRERRGIHSLNQASFVYKKNLSLKKRDEPEAMSRNAISHS